MPGDRLLADAVPAGRQTTAENASAVQASPIVAGAPRTDDQLPGRGGGHDLPNPEPAEAALTERGHSPTHDAAEIARKALRDVEARLGVRSVNIDALIVRAGRHGVRGPA
jgi:hypothetical protein